MKKTNFIITIINILLVVMSISFIYALYKLNAIKNIYLFLISLFLILINYILIFLFNKKKPRKIILPVISFIISVILFILITYIISTFEFIEKTTSNLNEYSKYSVLVKDSKIKINDLNNKKIGFIECDDIENIKTSLSKSANIALVTRDYRKDKYIIKALDKKEVDAIVINSNTLDIFNDNKIDLYKNYKSIYNFDVSIKNDYNNTTNINKPFIVLISGSTNKKNINETTYNDINILMSVNPVKEEISFIYLPSNLFIKTNGTSKNKDLLKFSSIYGISKTINNLNDFFDIKINYYIKVNDFNKKSQKENITNIINKINDSSTILKYNKILDKNMNNYNTNMSYEDVLEIIKNNMFKDYKISHYEVSGDTSLEKSYLFDQKFDVIKINDDEVKKISKKLKK